MGLFLIMSRMEHMHGGTDDVMPFSPEHYQL